MKDDQEKKWGKMFQKEISKLARLLCSTGSGSDMVESDTLWARGRVKGQLHKSRPCSVSRETKAF